MLFERLAVYHDDAHGAALNMAIDEAVLESRPEPTLRFYGWLRPSLSFGYFVKFAEVAEENEARALVRRWTGGGSVPHGDDVTYSLFTPATHPLFRQGPAAIYAAAHGAIRHALLGEGLEPELAAAPAPKISDACFANPVRDDVMLRGRKVAGAAQRRTRAGLLHQGSIQVPNLGRSFRQRLAQNLSSRVEICEIPAPVLERAAILCEEKYATDEWLRRR